MLIKAGASRSLNPFQLFLQNCEIARANELKKNVLICQNYSWEDLEYSRGQPKPAILWHIDVSNSIKSRWQASLESLPPPNRAKMENVRFHEIMQTAVYASRACLYSNGAWRQSPTLLVWLFRDKICTQPLRALVDDFGGDMLETQRFHIKWGHKCGNQNVYNFINIEPRLKL